MNKTKKILVGLLLFSLTISIVIYYLLGKYVDMIPILVLMFLSIYGGSFAAILLTSKKFKRLSSADLGFKFFATLCILSLAIFAALSCLIIFTVPIYFKPGLTPEQAQRVYLNSAVLLFMPVKMFVGTFIGMLLAVMTTKMSSENLR